MRLQRSSSGQPIRLEEGTLLGAGGEARIYVVPEDGTLVAKVWHKPTAERAEKVRAMLANPPVNPSAAQSHCAIAWPVDTLHVPGHPQRVAGFVMPRVVGMRPVVDLFNPKTRREQCPLFNYLYLVRTARNLASAVRALHERGYVVGDLNESNVLVAETALVTLVDTDSFQVWDARNATMYRCKVGKPEFTAPELQGRNFSQMNREPVHDQFALGVLVFQLLMEGTHPYAGIYRGYGDPPPYEQRIAAAHFPHVGDPRVPYTPKPTSPPFEILPAGLQNLFVRCFCDGHRDPSLRPRAESWQWMIEEAELHLVACWTNSQHVHGDHLDSCPWCARARVLGGRDPFPSAEAVRHGHHLQPPVPAGKSGAPDGRPHRPPPVPPPIPPSTGSSQSTYSQPKSRGRPLLGDWNDWAWVSLVLGGLSVLSAAFLNVFGVLLGPALGLLALISGVMGEMKSRSIDLEGRGKWLARIGFTLGVLGVLSRLFRPL